MLLLVLGKGEEKNIKSLYKIKSAQKLILRYIEVIPST